MASLFDYAVEFLQTAQAIEDMDIELETMVDTLDSLAIPYEQKAENVIKFIKNLEAMAEARKAEAKRLTEAATRDLKKVDGLIKYLDSTMQIVGRKKLTAGVFEIGYRKGSEVVEIDEQLLPDQYFTVETIRKPIGKPEIKKALKDGEFIPGVNLKRNPDKLVIK